MSDFKITKELLTKLKALSGYSSDHFTYDVINVGEQYTTLSLSDGITLSLEHKEPGRLKVGDRVTFDKEGNITNISVSKASKESNQPKLPETKKEGCDFKRKLSSN